jgi:hypothetical protein
LSGGQVLDMRDHKLSSLGNLLGGALSRHGIGERVVAAQIVTSANELLRTFMPATEHLAVRVTSFRGGELRVACKTPAARYVVEGIAKNLCRRLEEEYPNQTFKGVQCRLQPSQANDEEWYNGLTV